MFGNRPNLYFRRKGKGAAVYRVEENSNSQLNLQQIAMLKPNGEVKTQGKQEVSPQELKLIEEWKAARESQSKQDTSEIDTYVTKINNMAQWIQSKASDEEINSDAQNMLMAIHDLRSILVRRLAGKS